MRLAQRIKRRRLVRNVFCATGEGGGIDPTCSPSQTDADVDQQIGEFIHQSIKEETNRLAGKFVAIGKVFSEYPLKVRVRGRTAEQEAAGVAGNYSYKTGTMDIASEHMDLSDDLQYGKWSVGGNALIPSIRHEIGHHIDNHLTDAQVERWYDASIHLPEWRTSAKSVSEYAGTNGREYFAESFAAYTHPSYKKGSLPTPVEKFFNDLLGPTTNQLVINPFVSEAQRRACYAKDDPNWDCAEWQSKTKGRLPKRKKKLTTNRNPLRTDPTRTSALRRAFYRAIISRLNELKRRVNTLVLAEKSFALNVFCATGEGGGIDPTCSSISLFRGMSQHKYAEIVRTGVITPDTGNIHNDVTSDLETAKYYASTRIHDEEGVVIRFKVPTQSVKADEIYKGDYKLLKPVSAVGHEIVHGKPVINADYKFLTLPSQVEAFRRWLGQQIVMLFGSTTEQIQESFWYQYVQEGFEKGAGRAFDSMAKSLGLEKGMAKWSFLRSAFGNAVSVDKVKLVAGRVFTELKGVTDAMAQGMTRVLADGLAQGQSPRTVAREMTKQVDDIGAKRALVIARTETSRAHAEGQLIAMDKLGAQRLGVQVEWSPSGLGVTKLGNPSPCPECAKYVGKIYTVEKAQGLIPHHPNCLCSWIPYTQFSKKTPTNNLAFNVFCATGEGGGIDPTCSLHPKIEEAWSDYGTGAIIKALSKGEKIKVGDVDVIGSKITADDIEKGTKLERELQEVASKSNTGFTEVWRGTILEEGTDVKALFKRNSIHEFGSLTAVAADRQLAEKYTDLENFAGGEPGVRVLFRIGRRGGVGGVTLGEGSEFGKGQEAVLPKGSKFKVSGHLKMGDIHIVELYDKGILNTVPKHEKPGGVFRPFTTKLMKY